MSDALRELFLKALSDKELGAQYAVNEIQKQVFWLRINKIRLLIIWFLFLKLQCCGNVGVSDYANDIPPSCSLFVVGCNQAFYDFYRRYVLMLSLIGLLFGFTLVRINLYKIKSTN